MIKHLDQVWFESCDGTQECGIDTQTHTFESQAREWILYSQVETERLNGSKSVVSPFDKIRREAGGIES
jgi:hypothetical protein